MNGGEVPADWAARVRADLAASGPQLVTISLDADPLHDRVAALLADYERQQARAWAAAEWNALAYGTGSAKPDPPSTGAPCASCGGARWVCADHPGLLWGGACYCAGPGTAELYCGPLRVTWPVPRWCEHGACHCGAIGEPCHGCDSYEPSVARALATEMPFEFADSDAYFRRVREMRETRWLAASVWPDPRGRRVIVI